ncbi:MAG: methylenetetrahydrofolate reductase [Candidatus Lindowbacteria bacterium]|nr:methylenetetrahydrofolate reductase [Candidatus Lindowbacteria bacterium]
MITLIEMQTPLLPDIERCVSAIAKMDEFDSVILETVGGINAVAMGTLLKGRCNKEIFLKITCRDKNRIALYSDLTTAAAAGLLNVVVADGVHPAQSQFPAAKPVYDLDSLSLLRMIKSDSPAFSPAHIPPLSSLAWNVGVCVGGLTSADIGRARKFVSAGADLFFVGSLAAISQIKQVTDKPVFLSVPAEHTADLSEILDEAEKSGASGINIIAGAADRVFEGI